MFLLAVCVAVLLAYDFQLRTGDLLLSVFAVIAALLVPYLSLSSPELSGTIAFWLMVNLAIAVVASWVAFLLLPEPQTATPQNKSKPVNLAEFDKDRRLLRLACVAIPFVSLAFVFDLATPFVLVFVAIQSTQTVSNTSGQGGASQNTLIANALGGFLAVVVYEAMVAAPILPFALLALLAAMLWLSGRLISGDARVMSAITAFLILVGGTLMPFADDAQTKMLARLWQLGLAFGYLACAFALLDRLLPER